MPRAAPASMTRRGRIAVIYPAGTGNTSNVLTWNGGACCGYAMRHQVDDVGWLDAAFDDVGYQRIGANFGIELRDHLIAVAAVVFRPDEGILLLEGFGERAAGSLKKRWAYGVAPWTQ